MKRAVTVTLILLILGLVAVGVLLLVFAVMDAGDSSDDSAPRAADGTPAPPPSATPDLRRDPSPRVRAVPEGEPYAFQPPAVLTSFERRTLRGQPTATQSGGQVATYTAGSDAGAATVVLTAYYFDEPEQARQTALFTLDSDSIADYLAPPYDSAVVAHGIGQRRDGGYVAAWSHYGWAFIVQAPDRDTLDEFLDAFPH